MGSAEKYVSSKDVCCRVETTAKEMEETDGIERGSEEGMNSVKEIEVSKWRK